MTRIRTRRAARAGLVAVTAALSLALAACSDDSGESNNASGDDSSTTSDSQMTDSGSDMMADTFGPGCADVPTDPANPGSFESMAQAPVATAAGGNPVLSTLVTAVGAVPGLADQLNAADDITVFAPANSAFDKVDKATLDGLLADPTTLKGVLSYHVVPQKLTPDQLAGTFPTLAGDDKQLTVSGRGEDFTVGDAGAKVVCGNVQTANATVYIIDSVLMPPA